ncbi:MAG: hypothetical protein BMS9Abin37_2644 [Acidobacteriota bacterium]|nr:MAG: hypothetical protein BMS9Abin37_2644 [Acidobacteriota bacterium]
MTESGKKFGKKFDRSGHVIEVVAEAEALDKQQKSARVELVSPAGGTFTIDCDEGAYLRGDNTAPPPLSYLTSSIAF